MKIIHTSDLHLGQIIYQHYDRADEHDFFFSQLRDLCIAEAPDALVVSGDVFDIQQPSAATWHQFTDHFVKLRRECPGMHIIITAGNHDSPSRLHSHRSVWKEIDTDIVALPPVMNTESDEDISPDPHIIKLNSGYIIALPYMASYRAEMVQQLLDRVALMNTAGLPVVMMAHQAVEGCDLSGHDMEIGNQRAMGLSAFGAGFDYLALGHIHKSQTLGAMPDTYKDDEVVVHKSPVARYSGSVLHVSCDESYPHSVSIVEIDHHAGDVRIRTHRIHQLRHFFSLPIGDDKKITNTAEALQAIQELADIGVSGYVRFRIGSEIILPADFNQSVYTFIEHSCPQLRYNPKIDWIGEARDKSDSDSQPKFEVAELQQMTDPLQFIEKTIDQYPGLDFDILKDAFIEIREEVRKIEEENMNKSKSRK